MKLSIRGLTKHKKFARMYDVINFNQLRRRQEIMTKKKSTNEPKAPLTVQRALSGIGGIFMAFVVVSVAYSTYVVFAGTNGYAPKVMLIPQALFAAIIVIYKFAK